LSGGLRIDLHNVNEVLIGRGNQRHVESSGTQITVRVPSRAMSASHARLSRAADHWVVQDLRSTNGTFVDGEPVTTRRLRAGDVLELGHTLFLFPGDVAWPEGTAPLCDSASPAADSHGLSTLVPRFEHELALLQRIAVSTVPVLILGETGTGKELIAGAVHEHSRRPGPLVAVNCAAMPDSLVESQLFGHCRGAFSGAIRDQLGLVRAADRGTLLLDEIGDLPLSAQGALLRVLQEHEVLPVGATRAVKVNVRVVAATHRNLRAMADAGTFRADLLARLDGALVHVPPLRERRADLGLLVAALLRRIAGERAVRLALEPRAALALALYAWPANVRELEQALGRAVATADDIIRLEHLPPAVAAALDRRPAAPSRADGAPKNLREALEMQLRTNHGNVAAVARTFGKAPGQIHRWMRRFGLNPNDYRGAVELREK
jgi:transcriptional regulator with GAF, ATPase, and Fis domain